MADHDLRQVGALFGEHTLGHKARAGVWVGVHRDRSTTFGAGGTDCPHRPLDARGQTLLFDGALEEAGTHARVGDALAQVLKKELRQRFRDVEKETGTRVVELEGDLVVRVQAGGDDDVDVDLFGYPLHSR